MSPQSNSPHVSSIPSIKKRLAIKTRQGVLRKVLQVVAL